MDVTNRSANTYIRVSQEIFTPKDLLRSRAAAQAVRSLRATDIAVPSDDVIYGRVDLAFRAQGQGRTLKPGTVLDIQA